MIQILFVILIMGLFLYSMGYSCAMFWLYLHNWRKVTWRELRWPFFFSKWEKVYKTLGISSISAPRIWDAFRFEWSRQKHLKRQNGDHTDNRTTGEIKK